MESPQSCFRKAWGPYGRAGGAVCEISSCFPARLLVQSSKFWASPGSACCLLLALFHLEATSVALHKLQSRRARAAAAPARRASDSCCNSVRGSPEEPESGRRGRAPGRKERREPGLARAGTELAWLPDRGRVSAPAAPLAACPTPACCLCSGLWCSLLCRRGAAPRSWPWWLRVGGKNSLSG